MWHHRVNNVLSYFRYCWSVPSPLVVLSPPKCLIFGVRFVFRILRYLDLTLEVFGYTVLMLVFLCQIVVLSYLYMSDWYLCFMMLIFFLQSYLVPYILPFLPCFSHVFCVVFKLQAYCFSACVYPPSLCISY